MARPDPAVATLRSARRIHLVGIGGSGMSSLAALLARQGRLVSGSDLAADAATRLSEPGIAVFTGHHAEHLGSAELVIRSAAVPDDNPEVAAARQLGLPVLSHAAALGELMAGKVGVGVAGTHGKSTTTAMLGFLLAQVGRDPTVLVGATVLDFGSGSRVGEGRELVVEADEYDRRFLALQPRLAVITGIEPDHLDYFHDLDEIVAAFRAFVERVPEDGVVVTCADDPVLASLALPRRRVTYGATAGSWRVERFSPVPGGGCRFDLRWPGGLEQVTLQLSGQHNALNAAAACAAVQELGVTPAAAAAALASFRGTERRFQTRSTSADRWLVDDYAHHPTAVRATIAAARDVHAGRLWVVFQPHTTNRVAELLDEFATCFVLADRLTLLPIYRPAGRERGERPITAADLAAVIGRPPVSLAGSFEQATAEILAESRPGDLILFMGAGDVVRLSEAVAAGLASRVDRAP